MRERPSRLRSVQDLQTSKGGRGSPMNQNRLPTIRLLRRPKRPRSPLRQSTTHRGNTTCIEIQGFRDRCIIQSTHVLDAIVAGAQAPKQVSEQRGERRVDPDELGGSPSRSARACSKAARRRSSSSADCTSVSRSRSRDTACSAASPAARAVASASWIRAATVSTVAPSAKTPAMRSSRDAQNEVLQAWPCSGSSVIAVQPHFQLLEARPGRKVGDAQFAVFDDVVLDHRRRWQCVQTASGTALRWPAAWTAGVGPDRWGGDVLCCDDNGVAVLLPYHLLAG
jgi:hypothetical protein